MLFQSKREHPSKRDVVIAKLHAKWFEMAAREKYPRTPAISRELDNIEFALLSLRNGAAIALQERR